MATELNKALSLEIENISERTNVMKSLIFSSGGYEGRRRLFCAETPSWGVRSTLPLTKLQEKGFLEENKVTIEVYIKVFEVVDAGKSTENDVLDYNGFNIIPSQTSYR
ncbi:hypothetical protein Rs2_21963 [Raphanus sativus]|nr:hypothetical protein Rs2_21963 [Raphanus sativus]